ncbi:GSCFA domain-containing protein [Prevotella sp. PINT]|jgi:Lysophospholipase L1 and related esterases|uniref:GSCFA domain-containing protein n=1 Tax=Palleniella intestinalis TaxID=2736291 RepID=UPI0015534A9F|nr:GSCFA domain-containing protein [Palleniella intestinalis]NPD81136.1 GSCFA domain-containing protein [Palleniella intestinalis]
MDLYTPVTLPPHAITLETDSKVMMLGSCFAENVGGQLQMRMGNDKVDVNPFGVLYNPASIAQALRLLMRSDSKSIATDEKYIFHGQDGAWHSWLHSSHFSDMTKEGCLEKIASRLYSAKAMLKEATLLCITFGTTRHYVHNNIVVANCHKEPQRCFTESEMSLDELTAIWRDTIKALSAFNPKLRICLTVSPYRYKKYGFHESQLQKAKLLLLCDNLCNNDYATYFPSYEIQLDELRDYRFYKDDMLHPSDLAVSIISERFMDWTFSPDMKTEGAKRLKEYRRTQHRQLI